MKNDSNIYINMLSEPVRARLTDEDQEKLRDLWDSYWSDREGQRLDLISHAPPMPNPLRSDCLSRTTNTSEEMEADWSIAYADAVLAKLEAESDA